MQSVPVRVRVGRANCENWHPLEVTDHVRRVRIYGHAIRERGSWNVVLTHYATGGRSWFGLGGGRTVTEAATRAMDDLAKRTTTLGRK